MYRVLTAALLVAILTPFTTVHCDDETHTYTYNEPVTIWYNHIGPYHNPQETYEYYSLPLCSPTTTTADRKPISHRRKSDASLGVLIGGDSLVDSGMVVHYGADSDNVVLCQQSITTDNIATLTRAAQQHYWYEMYIDELPVWGMLGEYMMTEVSAHQDSEHAHEHNKQHTSVTEQAFLYTHREFVVGYNNDRIIEVNLTSENPRAITVGQTHAMTYTIKWVQTAKEFDTRFDRYLDIDFFEHNIHWFSLFNSFMMVVFLCGLVALILMRTLKNDYARYAADEHDIESVVDNESGWKQIHGDVFRQPVKLTLYCSIVGIGYQLLAITLCTILYTLVDELYDERGSMSDVLAVLYTVTSFVAGYTSASLYKRHGGQKWKKCMVMTATQLPTVVLAVNLALQAVAYTYDNTSTISVTANIYIAAIWLFLCCPLVLAGTLFGRQRTVVGDWPCRINSLRRPIPAVDWYMSPTVIGLLAGILPFGSIFIEIYFIFTSFWNYKFYYVYGFMLLVYLILCVVTMCVTVVATYIQLNNENYQWQWFSIYAAGSTAFYILLYSTYYFAYKTRMFGTLQTAYYFGYTLLYCVAVFIGCGTVGHVSASMFVGRIYRYIKSD